MSFISQLALFIGIVIGWTLVGALIFMLIFLISHIAHKENRDMGLKRSFFEFIPTYENRIDWSVALTTILIWPLALFIALLAIVCVDDFGAMGP